ncbi:acyltransferase [Streptococcus dentiloxodontae]
MTAKQSRHPGIELARIAAMFMICGLHVLTQGGILDLIKTKGSPLYVYAWCLQILVHSSVNIYALISGYVGLTAKHHYGKLLTLWLQVLFYSLLITGLISLIEPNLLSSDSWLTAFSPIYHNYYWYMTAYFGLYFFVPFLNTAIQNQTKSQAVLFFITTFLVFAVIPFVFDEKVFSLDNGYSMIWLIYLYILGAYIKKYKLEDKVSFRLLGSAVFLSTLITYLFILFKSEFLLHYTSGTILTSSLAIFLIFAKIKRIPERLEVAVTIVGPLSLGVYLSHVHPLIYDHFIPRLAQLFSNVNGITFAVLILAIPTLFFLLGICLDAARDRLFRLFKINALPCLLDKKLHPLDRINSSEL